MGRVENIVGNGENVPAFYPFPIIFSKGFFFKVVKSCDGVIESLIPSETYLQGIAVNPSRNNPGF